MSDPVNTNDPISNRERDHQRSVEWSMVPLGGLAIIAVGLIFLARNFGLDLPLPDRWWAIFILLPAAGALVSAGGCIAPMAASAAASPAPPRSAC